MVEIIGDMQDQLIIPNVLGFDDRNPAVIDILG
jgi:hypothetical protein